MFQDNKIKSFLTLAETRSFTKAAGRLYMSQQAVSRCVALLEEELNAKLFIRTTRSVELTSAGRMYYDLYSDLNRRYDEGLAQIREKLDEKHNRTLRLGIQTFMDMVPVLDAIADAEKTAPGIRVETVCAPPSVIFEQFENRLLDAAVMLDRFLPETFAARKRELISTPLYLLISNRNPLTADADAGFESFASLPYITDLLENEELLAYKVRAQHDIKRWGLSPEDIVLAYDRDSALTYAELGHGFVIDSNLGRIARGRQLVQYSIGVRESLWFLYRKAENDDAETELLVEAFEKTFRALEMP
ncbi:MAG: LysR family transcriptional regulator [Clostridiales Family XIII bacterium]|nr:LysR family transcriptional regulator [Clostridiales Family XIII bacterium]